MASSRFLWAAGPNTTDFEGIEDKKDLFLLLGTREMAFVHAISSAGVAHALTRACSSGELENCGCDRSLRGTSPQGFEVRKLND